MNLAERIKKAEEDLIKQKDQLTQLTETYDTTPDGEEKDVLAAEMEETSNEIVKLGKHIELLRRTETSLATRAAGSQQSQQQPSEPGAPAFIHRYQLPTQERVPGDLIWKIGTIKALAFLSKKTPEQIMEERYKGNDAVRAAYKHVAGLVNKTAVAPADTTTSGWAAELVDTDLRGFLDTLEPVSIAAALARRSTRLSFDGFASITVPRMNPLGAALTEPAWVGEGGAIPLTQFSFGSATINRYKLAAITTMTYEIIERSTPQIEGLMRSALTKAYARVLDAAFLSNVAAVAGVRPAGILNGVTVNAGSGAGATPIDNIRADIQTMVGAMIANQMGAQPVLIVNEEDRLAVSMVASPLGEMTFRDELSSGRLLGIDVVSSTSITKGTVIMIDAAALATAFDAPEFNVSDVATVVEANADATPPTMADDGTGAAGTAGQVPPDAGIPVAAQAGVGAAGAGYTARSLWQTYSAGIRMIAPTSWALLRPNAVVALNTLQWS